MNCQICSNSNSNNILLIAQESKFSKQLKALVRRFFSTSKQLLPLTKAVATNNSSWSYQTWWFNPPQYSHLKLCHQLSQARFKCSVVEELRASKCILPGRSKHAYQPSHSVFNIIQRAHSPLCLVKVTILLVNRMCQPRCSAWKLNLRQNRHRTWWYLQDTKRWPNSRNS